MTMAKYVSIAVVALGAMAAATTASADGDAKKGARIFNQCKACHTLEPGTNRVGPSLACVIGREAASVEDFRYSNAMEESGIVWNEDILSEYLKDPRAVLPKGRMVFIGLKKEEDREDLIAYLQKEAMGPNCE